MKNTNRTVPFSGIAVAATLLMTLCNCASTKQRGITASAAASAPATPALTNWHQVSQSPPTFYPVGVSADAPTAFDSGEWVYAGGNGERWFIPRKLDTSTRALLREDALARRSGKQLNGMALDNASALGMEAAKDTLLMAGAIILAMASHP